MEDDAISLTAEECRVLSDLVRRVESHEGSFGTWSTQYGDGTPSMPWVKYVPIADEVGAFLAGKLTMVGFDWRAWDAGWRVLDQGDRVAIETCTARECRQYVTLIYRSERFGAGVLLGAFDKGLMLALLRRILELGCLSPEN